MVTYAGQDDSFAALSDPTRREILRMLGEGGRSVSELAAALPVSRPAVSRHLRVLREAGLVGEEPLGTRRIYHLRAEGLEAVRAYLEQVWGDASLGFSLAASDATRHAGERRG